MNRREWVHGMRAYRFESLAAFQRFLKPISWYLDASALLLAASCFPFVRLRYYLVCCAIVAFCSARCVRYVARRVLVDPWRNVKLLECLLYLNLVIVALGHVYLIWLTWDEAGDWIIFAGRLVVIWGLAHFLLRSFASVKALASRERLPS